MDSIAHPLALAALGATAAFACALAAALLRRRRRAARKRDLNAAAAAIARFFGAASEDIALQCVLDRAGTGIVALIEPTSMRSLRNPRLVAQLLCTDVEKACGLTLAKVYWRFPPAAAADTASVPAELPPLPAPVPGAQAAARPRRPAEPPPYEVTESSWEHFSALAQPKSVEA